MAETNRGFLDRLQQALADVAPGPETSGSEPDLEAKHAIAMERLRAARRAGPLVSEDELRTVRLAVERVRAAVGNRAARAPVTAK